jgi:hypothetical protein
VNKTKPEIVTEEHLIFLDELRESGVTNMYGAGIYIERNFAVSRQHARAILGYWMETFGERHPEGGQK